MGNPTPGKGVGGDISGVELAICFFTTDMLLLFELQKMSINISFRLPA
jgi:hypothetical protein